MKKKETQSEIVMTNEVVLLDVQASNRLSSEPNVKK